MRSVPAAVATIIAVSLATLVAYPAIPHRGLLVSAAVGLGVVLAAIGAVVVAAAIWYATPRGLRRHWRCELDRYTVNGPLFGLGCSLVSQHCHSVRNLRLEVRTPEGNRLEFPAPAARIAHIDVQVDSGEEVTGVAGVLIWGTPPRPGVYRFKWRMDVPVDGEQRSVTLATAKYRVFGS